MIGRAWAATTALLLSACAVVAPTPSVAPAGATAAAALPPPPREFRGAWVATVSNIDWPSKPGLSAAEQRAEAVALLDRARTIGLNALILQVRPAGDALYVSALEPWSEALSGVQGRAPGAPGEAAYDPLAFWVEQAHRRGLELHAWFNPYRARPAAAKSPLVAPHLALRRPDLVKAYGDQLWIDPGEPAAAAHTLAVIADVVRRYDIDGVHIDDYFYPYPVAAPGDGAGELSFPDDDSYARYRLGGGGLGRDDWRRANVDGLVQAISRAVHEVKPWVRFGISPFGIGRAERRPAGVAGFSQYDKLYANVERWLEAGWLDYLAPQLYWPIASLSQPFAPLLDSWIAANTAQRHLWPGLYTSQVARNWPAREVLDQVALVRTRSGGAASGDAALPGPGDRGAAAPGGAGASGHIHFSISALLQDRDGLATLLQFGPYAQPALVPASPWLGAAAPQAPVLRKRGRRVTIEPAAVTAGAGTIAAGADEAAARWAVWRRVAGAWHFSVQAAAERIIDAAGADAVAVSAVGRVGSLSPPAIVGWP